MDDAVARIEAAGIANFSRRSPFAIRSSVPVYHGAPPAEDGRRTAPSPIPSTATRTPNGELAPRGRSGGSRRGCRTRTRRGRRARLRAWRHAGRAQFLLRASELTLDPTGRSTGSSKQYACARPGRGRTRATLLDTVLERVQEGRQQAEAEWTQGLIWLTEGRGRDAARILARALASIAHYDDGFLSTR